MQENFQEFRGGSSGSGRSSEEENGYPPQYSCLGNPMDRGAWQTIVYGIAKELDTTQGLNNNYNYIMSRRRAEILFTYLPFCNCIYFLCVLAVLILCCWTWAFAGCGGQALIVWLLSLWSTDPRAFGLQWLWHMGSGVAVPGLQSTGSVGGTQVQLFCGTWDLSKPGIEPVSPTLVGRFFTTESPEKPMEILSYSYLFPSNQYLFLPSSKH